MPDLTKSAGNPSYGIEQHYQHLMGAPDRESMIEMAKSVVQPYIGKGMSPENYRQFEMTLEGLPTVEEVQKYLTNYILKGSGRGVLRTGGAYGEDGVVALELVTDDIDAIASFVMDDPAESLYDDLTAHQQQVVKLVESYGYKVALNPISEQGFDDFGGGAGGPPGIEEPPFGGPPGPEDIAGDMEGPEEPLMPGDEMEEVIPIQVDKALLGMLFGYIREISAEGEGAEEQVNMLLDVVEQHAQEEEAEGEPTGPVMTGEEDFQEIMDLLNGGGEEEGPPEDEFGGEEEEGPPDEFGGGEGGEEEGPPSAPPFESKKPKFNIIG